MTINEILNEHSHRPWPIPQQKWQFYQEWNRVIFLHFKIDAKQLKHFVPQHLEIDCFEQQAWISIVAFDMNHVHPRNLPSLDLVSNFHEVNIRTYVKYKGKAGVYFLSIEASKKIAAFICRKLSALPYRFSEMERTDSSYKSYNKDKEDQLFIRFSPGNSILAPSPIELWLTERYAVFHDYNKDILSYHVHHPKWELKSIQISTLDFHYPQFQSLLKPKADMAHYAEGTQVLSWGKNI